MTVLRSGSLAVWGSAWLGARCAPDDVLAAVSASGDAPHTVSRRDVSGRDVSGRDVSGRDVSGMDSLLDVLAAWRRSGSAVRLVLPVPGDVRGVPEDPPLRAAAFDAGAAVIGGAVALVPEVVDHHPSSAPTSVTWHVFSASPAAPDVIDAAEAQYELAQAIRDTATALRAAEVDGTAADVADALRSARAAGERLHLPPDHPPRAVALLAQAHRMQAVLDLAGLDPVGGAVDRFGMSARDAALRPLAAATRRALLAGYNAAP